jgi:hypothetical protein
MTKEAEIAVAHTSGEGQQSVSVSTTSAKTTNAIGAEDCLVYTTVECFVLAGADPTATTAAGTPLAANSMIRLSGLNPVTDKLAFITATGTGTAYVRPSA